MLSTGLRWPYLKISEECRTRGIKFFQTLFNNNNNCGSCVIAVDQLSFFAIFPTFQTDLFYEQHCSVFGDYSHFCLRLKLSRGTIIAANIGQAMVNLKLWLSKSSSSHRQLEQFKTLRGQHRTSWLNLLDFVSIFHNHVLKLGKIGKRVWKLVTVSKLSSNLLKFWIYGTIFCDALAWRSDSMLLLISTPWVTHVYTSPVSTVAITNN